MPAFSAVACPSCGTLLGPRDVSLDTLAGRCPGCQALVDLRGAVPPPAAAVDDVLPVPLPRGVHLEDRGRDMVIVRRWYSPVYIFLAFFAVMWNAFLVVWYAAAFAGDAPLLFKLFPLLHVAAGIGISYATLAGFLNRTTITVERDHLTVRHAPVPWSGNLDVSTLSLEQLYCTEKVHRGRNGTTVRYGVEAVLKDGRNLKVVTGLDDREQALFIEERMERHLGIPDRRVRSEMPR